MFNGTFVSSIEPSIRLYNRMCDTVCAQFGLTSMELYLLLSLERQPAEDTAAALVRRHQLTKSHVSGAVATLEAKQYLAREYYPGDRRSAHLRILPAAAPAIAAGKAAQQRFMQVLLRDISPEDLAATERVINQMNQNIVNYRQEDLNAD